MNTVSLKWKKLSKAAELPRYATAGAACFDMTAALTEPLIMEPGRVYAIATGLACEVPVGFELQIRARSGLALKFGFTLVNGIGTIDSDYRGEIKAIATILAKEVLTIQPGDRICQGIVCPVLRVQHVEERELTSTERGVGGFGSTGINV